MAILSSVLRTQRAIRVYIEIICAFVKLHEMLASNKELAQKLGELEKKYDAQFKIVFDAVRQIMQLPERPKRLIGFDVEEPHITYKGSKEK